MKLSIHARRAELIELIGIERDLVAGAWSKTLRRAKSIENGIDQIKQLSHNPGVVIALVICVWMVGWKRGMTVLNNVAAGWHAWRRISAR